MCCDMVATTAARNAARGSPPAANGAAGLDMAADDVPLDDDCDMCSFLSLLLSLAAAAAAAATVA